MMSEQFQNIMEKSQEDSKIKSNTPKAHIYLSRWFNIKTLHRRYNFLKTTI